MRGRDAKMAEPLALWGIGSGAVVVVGTQLIGRVARLFTQQVETGTIEAINPWAQRTERPMYCRDSPANMVVLPT